jgi:hypothetical protein
MRQKKPLESTVLKYIDFLKEIHSYALPNTSNYKTIQQRIKDNSINKSILIALRKLEIIHLIDDYTWDWFKGDANKTLALEVLNYLLELNKKQIVTPIAGLDEDTKGYIKAIHDHLISNANKQNDSTQGFKTSMLGKALNQAEQNPGNHLFSKVENDESKKFELLKVIVGGIYGNQYFTERYCTPEMTNIAIDATEDLFNKFFKVK